MGTNRGGTTTMSTLRNVAFYLAAILFVIFCLFPLYMMITTALKTDKDAFAWPPPWIFYPSLQSYYNALFLFGGGNVVRFAFNAFS